MLKVQVINADEILKELDETLRKKAPMAIKKGLDRGAFDVRALERGSMVRQLDRPTPFTRRGVAVRKAQVRNLTAYIYILPIQAEYLRYQIKGGTSYRKKVVPARSWPKNAYGNLARGVTSQKNVIKNRFRGRRTYWKIQNKATQNRVDMIGFVPFKRSYRKRWDYYGVGAAAARRHVPIKVSRELQKAGVV